MYVRGNISLESGCKHTLMHWKVAADPIQGDLRWRLDHLDHLDQAPVPPLTWDRHLSGKGWKAPVSKQEKVCFRWRHKSSLPYSYFQDGFQIFWMRVELSWTGRLWSIPIPLDSKTLLNIQDCQKSEIERICLQIIVCGRNVAQASLNVHFEWESKCFQVQNL